MINAKHRKHFKSGSCLSQHAMERPLVISRKFGRMLDIAFAIGKRLRLRRQQEQAA